MIPEDILFSFCERERDTYGRQGEYGYFKLAETKDLLDVYSSHSESHVLEVIEQSRMLYEALCPFFKESHLAGCGPLPDELLVAAKLHDISMGGSRKEIALLDAVDSMHEWLRENENTGDDERMLRGKEVQRLAEETGITEESYHSIAALLSIARMGRTNYEQLEDVLGSYHDEIKTYIRKHHAPSGGAWIFQHAAEILERYGTELDLKMVVALVILHSTSSTAVNTISCNGDENETLTRTVLCDFMKTYLTACELEQIMEDAYYKRLIYLASILRLADTRRQGNLLQTIDRKELEYRLCEDGTADLYRIMPWGPERITDRMAHSILLSECCTRFGSVILQQRWNGWIFVHEMTVYDSQNPEVMEQFVKWRLYSYVNEVDTGAFAQNSELHHVFRIRLNGVTDKATATKWETDWRNRWKNGDAMQKRYAETIEVQIEQMEEKRCDVHIAKQKSKKRR